MRIYTHNTLYHADCIDVRYPSTISEVQAIVRDAKAAGRGVRVQGNGYVNNPTVLPDDGNILIRTSRLEKAIRMVSDDTVEVSGGVSVVELNRFLTDHRKQLAVPTLFPVFNILALAVVPYVATHPKGCFWSENVVGYTLVTATGELLEAGEAHELVPFLRTSSGLFGIAVKVLVRVLPQVQYFRTYRLISKRAAVLKGERVDSYEGFFLPNAQVALVWEEEAGGAVDRVRHSRLHDALFEASLWPFLALRRLGRAKRILYALLRLATYCSEHLNLRLRLPLDPCFVTVIGFAGPRGYLVRHATFNPIALKSDEYRAAFGVVDGVARRYAATFDSLLLVGTVKESSLAPMYNSYEGGRPFFELFPLQGEPQGDPERANEMQLEVTELLSGTSYLSTLHHGHQYHPPERLFGPLGFRARDEMLQRLQRHDPDGMFMNDALRHAFGLPHRPRPESAPSAPTHAQQFPK